MAILEMIPTISIAIALVFPFVLKRIWHFKLSDAINLIHRKLVPLKLLGFITNIIVCLIILILSIVALQQFKVDSLFINNDIDIILGDVIIIYMLYDTKKIVKAHKGDFYND